MKLFALLSIFVPSLAFGQWRVAQDIPEDFHMHRGFYLSLTGGPAFGSITINATNASFGTMKLGGGSFQFDFKIGGVISEELNLILSCDVISRSFTNSSVTIDGSSVSTITDVTARDAMYGVGLTKYFMPDNIFISGTVGIGDFTMDGNNNSYGSRSKSGFGLQGKGGKEWWVSDYWGLGVAAGLGYLSADDQADPFNPAYSARISTTKFFVAFNTTFN